MAGKVKGPTRVLYLTYDGLTDPLGESQILPYITGINEPAYEFTIVSFEKKIQFIEKQKVTEKLCEEHSICWIHLIYHKTPPVLSTLYDLYKLYRTANKLQKKNHFNIVHCRSYLVSLIGIWLKRKYHIRFLFDMRGFWADERVEGGLWNLRNPIYYLIFHYFKKRKNLLSQKQIK